MKKFRRLVNAGIGLVPLEMVTPVLLIDELANAPQNHSLALH